MYVTLIHSPSAGHDQPSAGTLQSALREAGHEVSYLSTDDNLDEAFDRDLGDLVVLGGGDGTVGGIAPRLIGHGVPIGVLPLGTANNIARSLGIRGSVEEIIAGWPSARRRKVDVGMAEGPWGTSRFLESVGVGFFAQMLPVLSTLKKQRADPADEDEELRLDLDFLEDLLDRYRAHEWELSVDGVDCSGRYLLVEAMNIGAVGPRLDLAPEADPSDGYLDVVFVTEEGRGALAHYLAHRREPPFEARYVRRGRHLQMRWEGAEVHIDSQVWAQGKPPFSKSRQPEYDAPHEIDLRLEAGALEVLVPA